MSQDSDRVQQQKSRLRAEAQARRAALTPTVRRHASQRIENTCRAEQAVAQTGAIFVYVSTATEVETHALIDAFVAAGRTILVPLVRDRQTMLAVPFPGWQPMRRGALGILSPPPTPAYTGKITAALVPGLAFTTTGARLGYGGGYYDRWLTLHPGTTAIALAFDIQIVEKLAVAAHDVRIARIITESGALDCLA